MILCPSPGITMSKKNGVSSCAITSTFVILSALKVVRTVMVSIYPSTVIVCAPAVNLAADAGVVVGAAVVGASVAAAVVAAAVVVAVSAGGVVVAASAAVVGASVVAASVAAVVGGGAIVT